MRFIYAFITLHTIYSINTVFSRQYTVYTVEQCAVHSTLLFHSEHLLINILLVIVLVLSLSVFHH